MNKNQAQKVGTAPDSIPPSKTALPKVLGQGQNNLARGSICRLDRLKGSK